jgi:hypothetical protein
MGIDPMVCGGGQVIASVKIAHLATSHGQEEVMATARVKIDGANVSITNINIVGTCCKPAGGWQKVVSNHAREFARDPRFFRFWNPEACLQSEFTAL